MRGEESFHGLTCARSEEGERARFGRDEDKRYLTSFPLELRRRQEREFVQRKRPHNPGRNSENKAFVLARLHSVEESSEALHVRRAAKGQGSGDGDFRAGAAGEDDRVVPNAFTRRRCPGANWAPATRAQVGELPAEAGGPPTGSATASGR